MDRVFSNSKWEEIIGYCRLLIAGKNFYLSGTTATNSEGIVMYKDSPYEQTIYCLDKIKSILAEKNILMSSVVRTRLFVSNIDYWEDFGRAHGDFFRDFPPVTTMVEVGRLIDKDMFVEIEVEGIIE